MESAPTVPLAGREDLSLAYTPGVARVCEAIAADPSSPTTTPGSSNTVAVVTDGTAVLGLGDIGPRAAMPVMEGKAVLFKQFGGVDAVPICLDTTGRRRDRRDRRPARARASAASTSRTSPRPRCFEIERRLKRAAGHPGLPRRPARHGDRRARRAAQRARADRPRARRPARRGLRRRRGRRRGDAGCCSPAGVRRRRGGRPRGVVHAGRGDLTAVKQSLAATPTPPGAPGASPTRWPAPTCSSASPAAPSPRTAVAGDGAGRDHLRAGQPRPRGAPGRRAPVRRGGGHRALRLPQPDQQRAGVPGHLPGRLRRAGHPRSPRA